VSNIVAQFINVDLDLKSSAPLSPLLNAWSDRVGRLYAPDKDGRKHWLRLYLTTQHPNPEKGILEFCRLVRRLRGPARTAWQKASSREFDIGIQAGLEPHAAEWVLSRKVINAVHDVGAHVRLTVYSPRPLMEEEQGRRGRMVPADVAAKRISRVSVDSKQVRVYLADGPVFYLPLSNFYRLSKATRAQRANWQLIGNGRRAYWPDIDEDIAIDSLFEGIPVEQLKSRSPAKST
jgi:Protein of unknown function (DUF2442)